MEAYRAALASTEQTPQQRNMRTAAGSFGYVCLNYYASPTLEPRIWLGTANRVQAYGAVGRSLHNDFSSVSGVPG